MPDQVSHRSDINNGTQTREDFGLNYVRVGLEIWMSSLSKTLSFQKKRWAYLPGDSLSKRVRSFRICQLFLNINMDVFGK